MLPLFLSSGDLIADRRYGHAMDFAGRGDLAAAADLLIQALERAPGFASAWFALGDVRERAGDPAGAADAFAQARAGDPEDRHGAALRLARLAGSDRDAAMPAAYMRALFDQYAPTFDAALANLNYRAPALLRAAVQSAAEGRHRPFRFARMLDLGCGTGLAGEAFADAAEAIVGVDLAPAMIAQARRKGLYARLETADLLEFLAQEPDAGADLVVAADVLVYVADLAPVCRAVAHALAPAGLAAFTVETHAGDGVVLGEKLRYAHGAAHVRGALAQAGLAALTIAAASTRSENARPVPGLMVVAAHAD